MTKQETKSKETNSFTQTLLSWLSLDREFFIFLGILTIILYSFSWGNEFVSDDIWGIRDNFAIGNFWQQAASLNIKQIAFSGIYNLVGPKPFLFHIHNTIIHFVSIYVVYAFSYLVIKNKVIARLTSILFAVHPIEVEAVTWISGVPYAYQTLFALLISSIFIAVHRKLIDFKWIYLGAVLYIIVMRVTPTLIMLPGILLAYVVLFSSITKEAVKHVTPIAVAGGLYLVSIYYQFFGRVADMNPAYAGETTTYNPLLQIPTAIGTYVQIMLFPYNLTLYHEFLFYSRYVFASNVVLTVLVFLCIFIFWKRNKVIAFGLSLFVISLLPFLMPINIGWIVAERYVHLGTVGFFLAFSAGVVALTKRFRVSDDALLMGSVVVILILSGLTVKRNLEWRNQDTLWPVTVKHSPYSAFAHNNMGDYYGRHGDVQNAILSFERARKLKPRYGEATHNLANVYLAIGEATRAAELYLESVDYNPTLFQAYQKLAGIALAQGNPALAEQYLLKSIEINRDPFLEYITLVSLYADTGQEDKAREALAISSQMIGNIPDRQRVITELRLRYPSL